MKNLIGVLSCLIMLNLNGCAAEVGSEGWCNNLKEKAKGDWSASEATDFAKHCLFKQIVQLSFAAGSLLDERTQATRRFNSSTSSADNPFGSNLY